MYHKEKVSFVVLLDCCTSTVMSYFTWDYKPLQCMYNTEGYKT